MISSNKCTGSCNVLSRKIGVLKKTKDINVTAFNVITNKNEAKAMIEHISSDCKYKINITKFNSIQKWNNKIRQCECKNYCKRKKNSSWNPSMCTCIYLLR